MHLRDSLLRIPTIGCAAQVPLGALNIYNKVQSKHPFRLNANYFSCSFFLAPAFSSQIMAKTLKAKRQINCVVNA
jgi:hypothetical protein